MQSDQEFSRREVLVATSVAGLSAVAGSPALSASIRSASKEDWWEGQYRIVQTNLREIDVLEDPRAIAKRIRAFGADTIVSNVGGIVAFYPTQLEFHSRNPFLKHDFVGEMLAAARAEGLKFIARFDLTKSMKVTYEAHPEWFMVNRNGKPREYAGTYQACPNGEWSRHYSQQILTEALARYDVDGIFFNMAGYLGSDYSGINHGACICLNCRTRFQELYGRPLPQADGFADPAWPEYLEFQEQTTKELFHLSNAAVKKARPKAAVIGWDMKNQIGRWEAQRRVDRSGPEWAFQSGEQCRQMQALLPGKAVSATSTAHLDYPWRQALEAAPVHLTRFAQQLATGARLDLYLMGTFSDQDDHRFEDPVSDLFHWQARNSLAYAGVTPAARVAIYYSRRTERWGGGTASSGMSLPALRGAYMALAHLRIPFQMVADERVLDGTTKLTPDIFDAIILPNVAILTDEEAGHLDAYVGAGGLLIATGETGMYEGLAKKRVNMALNSSPVERLAPPVNARGVTLDGATASLKLASSKIPVDGNYYAPIIKGDSLHLLDAAARQPFGPPELSYSLPDAPRGEEVGIIGRRAGRGMAIHIPWHIDRLYFRDQLPDHSAIFASLLAAYAPEQPVIVTGNGPIEVSCVFQQSTGQLLVHIVNFAGQRNSLYEVPPDLHGLKLGVKRALSARTLVTASQLTPTQPEHDDGYTFFSLPPVRYFEAIQVTLR